MTNAYADLVTARQIVETMNNAQLRAAAQAVRGTGELGQLFANIRSNYHYALTFEETREDIAQLLEYIADLREQII